MALVKLFSDLCRCCDLYSICLGSLKAAQGHVSKKVTIGNLINQSIYLLI